MDIDEHARNPQHCTVCLVRHGETPWNAERRLQGHLDVPLNETGMAQAHATARNLAGRSFSALYVSDLARALQTAIPIARAAGIEAQPMAALRERHYGIFQGLTYAEAAERFPDAYRRFEAREPDFAFPGGGESLLAFADRIGGALTELARRHSGESILVVTHGGVLDVAHRLSTGKALATARDFPIPNAALNWLGFDADRGWRLIAWAERSHLQAARDELPNA
ncbi:histidine phosphatase family protein [Pseudothauera rhizosphaerae]|uniref:Histidine phosphatase family protein n=1 Tax=Pseudothauera rhizosphaerae TaxID=2565932 RepID=A0A4S4AMC9_9RHOO|nr:histidine phosphatase family protein [Pseudothauera rhizosphaerae]THF60713.1 histidine phosphatase family protein [Pseudothauera rhizosphaerae]